jgi:HEAT repeat protein
LAHSLGLALWAVIVMAVLNVLVVALTIGTKALRSARARRTESINRRLEYALDSSLATGEVHPDLLHRNDQETDLLAILLVEYLSLLSGAERERLVRLADETGLVKNYFARLTSRNRWRKASAAENLGYFGGQEAVAPLAVLLSNPDETVRAVAARALARIGSGEAVKALANTLNDPSELTRLRMAENLERLGHVAVEQLIDTLDRGMPPGRLLAVRVLGNLRAIEASPALREAMRDEESADVRAQAALALGKIGNPDDLPALIEAASDETWPVRALAASALGMIGDVSTIPTLRELTVDREWWVRLNASRALANIGPAGEKTLAGLLEGEDRYTRDRTAATLEERGIIRRAVEELDVAGQKGESARAMIRAMVKAGAVRYLDRLAKTLPDDDVREALKRTMQEAREGALES